MNLWSKRKGRNLFQGYQGLKEGDRETKRDFWFPPFQRKHVREIYGKQKFKKPIEI